MTNQSASYLLEGFRRRETVPHGDWIANDESTSVEPDTLVAFMDAEGRIGLCEGSVLSMDTASTKQYPPIVAYRRLRRVVK